MSGRPRLGFVGAGWIGRNRLEAVARSGCADIVAVGDADPDAAASAAAAVGAEVAPADAILDGELALDGVVIATPSALHAAQSLRALAAGMAVFSQKPLGRTEVECRAVVDAAERQDRLLGVDMAYRHLRGVTLMRDLMREGAIGGVFAAELMFHNAYGPDRAWYADPALSGGGCVIDLAIHLIDLALWMLGGPAVEAVSARLFAGGSPLAAAPGAVEDYAVARLDLATGTSVTLACSWFLHAGSDALIGATFHGTAGGLRVRNVGGSFYDFVATHDTGTASRVLAEPPDDWGGRAAVCWAEQLSSGKGFDPAAVDLVRVARVVDRVYGR